MKHSSQLPTPYIPTARGTRVSVCEFVCGVVWCVQHSATIHGLTFACTDLVTVVTKFNNYQNKEQRHTQYTITFTDTSTTEGEKHLGAALGSPSFVEDLVSHKVDEWIEEVEKLAAVTGSQPQAACAAYIHGTKNTWNYFCRTTPNCSHLLQPLEEAIHRNLLLAISGRPPCYSTEREFLSLPTKLGGIHFSNPTVTVASEFEASMEVTTPLLNLIIDQNMSFENDPTLANPIISAVKKRKLRKEGRGRENPE